MKSSIIAICCAAALSLGAGEKKVLAFAGSTRSDSVNKKLVKQAAEVAQEMGARVTVIDLRDYPMPLYDGDLEAESGMPETAKKFRALLLESDAIIIATPEYNGSIPGVLKNAIDWASRTEEKKGSRKAFKDKRFAVMSASPGKQGGADAAKHLSDILGDLGGKVVAERVSIGNAGSYFQESQVSETLKKEISQLIEDK